MVEKISQQNLSEGKLDLEAKVNVAMEQVDGLTKEIAMEMGNQWERDRFGKYKSEHMVKMTENSEEMIKNYRIDQIDGLAPYIPLFRFICRSHDLGRHFHDNNKYIDEKGKFLDHGEIGVCLLREKEIIKNFSNDEQKVIEYTIKNHSLKEMLEPVDEIENKARTFCMIFRDIDKLEVLNKRDFVIPKEIYRLLGLHFDLGEYKKEWKDTDKIEKYVEFIQEILNKNDPKATNGLEIKIKEIVDGNLQENIGEINIIEYLESGKSVPLSVYRETKSYSNYITFLLSFLSGIKYERTLAEVNLEEVQIKMDFLRPRTTEEQYGRIKAVLVDNYKYKVE